ncbi:hypothetical protein GGR50DRAFT_611927 [Xylaria sp. CBS 124048]|nr:hypothetical protein GGR50DRAFT_611927 [Xylaria sp. CBS 124048]
MATDLERQASRDSMISMEELEPSPIDTPDDTLEFPPLDQDLMSSSTSSPARSLSSLGLSGRGRGPIFYLTRIQRYSSYTFTFFAGLHFANTSLIPLAFRSVPYAEPFLLMTRELYQTPYTEPLLVGLPVLAHIVSGITIRLLRRRQNKKRYQGDASPGFWPLKSSKDTEYSSMQPTRAASRIWPEFNNVAACGYAFLVFLTSHVAMNRMLPLAVEGDSSNIGLGFVSHGFARHPQSAWFSYVMLLSLGTGHMVWGMAKWLDLAPPANWKKITLDKPTRRRRRRAWWAINATGVGLATLWAAGGLGVVARAGPVQGWLSGVYDSIYEFAGR